MLVRPFVALWLLAGVGACVGALSPLATTDGAPDASAGRDAGGGQSKADAARPEASDATLAALDAEADADAAEPPRDADLGPRVFSAPTPVSLVDSNLQVEPLEITEPWFGASNELYFRSGGVMAKESFNVSCDWTRFVCRSGGQLQFFGPNNGSVVRPSTLGAATVLQGGAPALGPVLYDDGRDLSLYTGKSQGRSTIQLAQRTRFAYSYAGSADLSAVQGNHLKVFRLVNDQLRELDDWGPFAGSYHAADSALSPTLLVYTDGNGRAAARVRDGALSWWDASELVASLQALTDVRMTWMSSDGQRIVFSARRPGEARATMLTATR